MSHNEYLRTRAVTGPWHLKGCTRGDFAGAVVIPALAESANLFATLSSLAHNPPDLCQQILVVVVVNHREDSVDSDKSDNLVTLEKLSAGGPEHSSLCLAWIDAASSGCELPVKSGGVGLARKIGLDLALTRLDFIHHNPILICLDADTLVQPDYLSALMLHFKSCQYGGGVIPFLHQQVDASPTHAAITRYELYLRSFVQGLSRAGSPYAFHSVGSAMACRASAYVKIGGMNSRSAGEDFYFLQQLARTVGVAQVRGTIVHPSQRASHRVPFGTGRSIARILEGDTGAVLFYHCECFHILAAWLELITNELESECHALLTRAGDISPHLVDYLNQIRFVEIWGKLRRNNPRQKALLKAFHGWFDGLKTMKLIHHLSATAYPRCHPEIAIPPLFQWCGLDPASDQESQLEVLRQRQLGDHYQPGGDQTN